MYTIHHSGFIFKQVSSTETVTFPMNEENELYKEYMEWVAEGNEAPYFPSPEEQLGN
jgi:hypothetical protein